MRVELTTPGSVSCTVFILALLAADVALHTGLTICGVDCLLSAEWKSANKIIARTGQARGTGDIVVATRSGGVGSATVQFRGYNIQIGTANTGWPQKNVPKFV